MDNILQIFSTREIATAAYIMLIVIYAFCSKRIRPSTFGVIKAALNRRIVIPFFVFISYSAIITVLFSRLPFWESIYIKDVVTWTLFAGVPICFNAISKEPGASYYKDFIINNIKSTAIVEYLFGTFTFNIVIELILQPIVFLISMTQVVADKNENAAQVKKLCDILLSIIGITILFFTVKAAVSEYRLLDIQYTAISFILPLAYSVLFSPVAFLFALIAKYEIVFFRMNFYDGKSSFKNKHRSQLIKICKFSIKRLVQFEKNYLHQMYKDMPETQFDVLIRDFTSSNTKAKRRS